MLWQASHEAARWRARARQREPLHGLGQPLRAAAWPSTALANKIAQAISDAKLPADCLCLEVAERAILDRRGDALAAIPDMETLGVRLLIDDFGVAISSFARSSACLA